MTLLERLSEIPDGTVVRIGAEDGTAWVVLDYVENFRSKDILERISKLFVDNAKKNLEDVREFLRKYPDFVKNRENEIAKLEDISKNTLSSSVRVQVQKELLVKKRKLEELHQKAERAENLTIPEKIKYIENFIPFYDREIVEEYEIDVFEMGIAIKFQGTDIGVVWTMDEFDKLRKMYYEYGKGNANGKQT